MLEFTKDTDWNEGVVLLFDKPLHWTSFNLVNKVKSLLRYRLGYKKIKVGHAGTLDPLATGLLVVCIGRATKRVTEFQLQNKEYIATFQLGATTPSFDLETQIDQEYPTEHITREMVDKVAKEFIGPQMQVPPLFSAKSIDGGRAYNLARRGVEMELDAAPIEITYMDVLDFSSPKVTLKVGCTKGTYIRSLARDFGKALGSGGHLVELRRTASGSFSVDNAMSLEDFEKKLLAL
jgi:tRNA pseudouridine55 synthase